MKKISLLTLMLGSGMALFAQNQPMGTMNPTPQLRTKMAVATRFGIKGGVNLAKLRIDDDANSANSVNTNLKTSLMEVFCKYSINGYVSFSTRGFIQWTGNKG